jgi:GTPase SAR1 family protein
VLYLCMISQSESTLSQGFSVNSCLFRRESFSNLSRWLADARALASPQLVVVLVGSKSDREEDREVEWAEASKWAAENGGSCSKETLQVCLHRLDVHFLETSSLTGENVEAPFLLAARAILLAIESGTLDPEKAGSGVSYGDRALRRVNSSSRLSFGSHQSVSRRRGTIKLRAKNWITGSKCC